jgi:hypothetical protein
MKIEKEGGFLSSLQPTCIISNKHEVVVNTSLLDKSILGERD